MLEKTAISLHLDCFFSDGKLERPPRLDCLKWHWEFDKGDVAADSWIAPRTNIFLAQGWKEERAAGNIT